MPYIEVRIAGTELAEEQLERLSAGITNIMADTLGKKRSLVAVSVETIPPQRWFIAGSNMAGQPQATAFVSARITQGTNTEAQKAAALNGLFQLLGNVLGIMAEASYVVLDEIPATDWGYGGYSQASRKAAFRRDAQGNIDTGHYLRRAHQLRVNCMYQVWRKLFRFMGMVPTAAQFLSAKSNTVARQ